MQDATLVQEILNAWPTPVIIGSLITLLGVFQTNSQHYKRLKYEHDHQEKINKKDLYILKGEELYMLLSNWSDNIFNEYRSFINENLIISSKSDYARMNTLVSLYFSDIQQDLSSAINKESYLVTRYDLALMPKYRSQLSDNEFIDQIHFEVNELSERINNLRKALKNSILENV
ncbi:hypothetical protein [Pseudoalteromonas apostichopi]|uniref:hypothetical protein n=1 Tax=Pseudoalteromonas apostichopi TaxID=3035452 RepID=UPI002573E2E8|nr:hypothetical protein [Pseudoalteromonas sp. FE4]